MATNPKTIHTWVVNEFNSLNGPAYQKFSLIDCAYVSFQIYLVPSGNCYMADFMNSAILVGIYQYSPPNRKKYIGKLTILKQNGDEFMSASKFDSIP